MPQTNPELTLASKVDADKQKGKNIKEEWENQISIDSFDDSELECLPAVSEHLGGPTLLDPRSFLPSGGSLADYVARDPSPLPTPKLREGFCATKHLEYWLQGLRDYITLKRIAETYKVDLATYLDFGCSSGRVLRHFGANEPNVTSYGCDINASRIRWSHQYLPRNLITFQNTSIPQLPLPDNSISLLTAFSIFTHIEAFQTTWLMEFRRILKPGGLAVLTVFSEKSVKAMTPDWPTYKSLCRHPKFDPSIVGKEIEFDRMIFRHSGSRSYSSIVFLHSRYIERAWGRILPVKEIRHRFPRYQDAVILQKE